MMRGFEDMMQQSSYHGEGFSSFSSSSSSGFGGDGGNWKNTSANTQMINGKKTPHTKWTTLQPDKTMETIVETSGNEDLQQALENLRMDMSGGSR